MQLTEYLYLGPMQMDQLGNLHSVKSMPKLIRVRDTLGMSTFISAASGREKGF
jgi:hypothetical protein